MNKFKVFLSSGVEVFLLADYWAIDWNPDGLGRLKFYLCDNDDVAVAVFAPGGWVGVNAT